LTRSIYRSEAGRHAIRTWCELRLDAAGATCRDLDTSLGTTRVMTLGDGADVVLLPGTNFSTATSLKLLSLVGRHVRTSLAPSPLPAAALAEVRCPVWLVAGRHDPFLPAQRLTDALTRLGGPTGAVVVDTAGHLVPEEAPNEVVRAVEVAGERTRRHA
jgi:pimeloyl-ACP methyl ester carboxylesterase